MHPGRSQRARISASSHTGALAGDHAVMTALLRHAAVIVVETLEELIDTAELLARFKPPVNGPGIITNSGAIKGFALDFCDRLGLDIPRLGDATLAALKAALPPFASLDNPVDVTAQVLRDLTIWTRTARGAARRSRHRQPVRADGRRARPSSRWTRCRRCCRRSCRPASRR